MTRPHNQWLVLLVLCLGLFMVLLDGTIVSVAIPRIMGVFGTGLSSAEWVLNGYVLSFAVSLISLGRLGDLVGRHRLFVAGMVLFVVASAACGLAPSIQWLIAFRVIQGISGAAMMPATLSIVATVFPPQQQGTAMGIWGGVSGLATAIGPSLGGFLVDSVSWRSIFLINLPIGAIGLVLALRLVPESKDPDAVRSLDLPGVALITTGLLCLTFGLVEGQRYGWSSALILGLFAVAAVLLIAFYFYEGRVAQPLIDFSLFRNRNFLVGNAVGFLLSAAMMGVFFTIPIFLQTVLGFSAFRTGLIMSPMSWVVMVAAPLAGWLSDRIGSKWIVAAGLLMLAFAVAWIGGLMPWGGKISPATDATSLLAPFIIAGFGIGLGIAPLTAAVMATTSRRRLGNASGVLSTLRQLGSLLGIAIIGAVLQNRIVANVSAGVGAMTDLPAGLKERILAGVQGGMSMKGMGDVGQSLPLLQQLTFIAVFQGWFADAIATALLVGFAFALVGAMAALLLRHHAAGSSAASDLGAAPAAVEEVGERPDDVDEDEA